MLKFGFYLPTRIHFGQGIVQEIGNIAKLYGKRAFIVTEKRLVKKLEILQPLEERLKKERIRPLFFDRVKPNPSSEIIYKGANLFKEEKCNLLIALGGGSCLDAAKAIGILAKNPTPLSFYFGRNRIKKDIPPLIAIPTTAGSGSEVTPYAVITDTEGGNHLKKVIADPRLFPREALIDPVLTISLSSTLTSDTAIDALSHAIESYLSRRSFPLSETIALEAVHIIGRYLPRALTNLLDMEARSYLMYAATLAGLAIAQTGATLLHTMGYPITSSFGLPHGRVNGFLLPWFWEYSFPGNPEKFSRVITCLLKDAKKSWIKDAKKSASFLKEFLHRSGLPETAGIKVKEEFLSQFARKIAESKEKIALSPKELTFEEILTIYKKAFQN